VGEHLLRRAEVRHPAAAGHRQDQVAGVEAQRAVRDHHDRPATIGEVAELPHHLAVESWIESGRRFVQVEQGRLGEQFHGHGGALALAAGEPVDRQLALGRQVELGDHRLGSLGAGRAGDVVRQAQGGRVAQRLPQGQLIVQDVFLRDETDPVPHLVVRRVEVDAVDEHLPLVGGATAGQRPQQGRLAGTTGPDDGDQAAGRHRERDIGEHRRVAVPDAEPVSGQ
jgi:hypothetical protein